MYKLDGLPSIRSPIYSCTDFTVVSTTCVSEIHKHQFVSAAWFAVHLKHVCYVCFT